MGFELIDFERDGRKAIITLKRPEALNAINRRMDADLFEAFQDIRDDPSIWVGIVTGYGERSFSAGHDMKEPPSEPRLSGGAQRPVPPMGGIAGPTKVWKPMIAAINGYCLGAGLEIALACDIRIAADHAEFGLPEVRWNLLASAGGLTRLPRAIPSAAAMKMILTGERINAQQALQWGLITDVAPLAGLMPLAHRIADTILENAPVATRVAKEIAVRTADMPLEDGLALEAAHMRGLGRAEDTQEGAKAFAEKRKAAFKGR